MEQVTPTSASAINSRLVSSSEPLALTGKAGVPVDPSNFTPLGESSVETIRRLQQSGPKRLAPGACGECAAKAVVMLPCGHLGLCDKCAPAWAAYLGEYASDADRFVVSQTVCPECSTRFTPA